MIDAALLDGLLAYVLLPLWLVAGGCDWLCHRTSAIERTSGVRESVLHVVLYLEILVALAAALYLRIDTLVIAICAAAVLLHTLTSLWDVAITQPRRHISPFEQHVHSWLEMLPVFALALVCVMHFDSLRTPDWSVALRPTPGAGAVLALLVLGMALPLEELSRCVRARNRQAPSQAN